ncbi:MULTISPECIES: tautomerase family protein [unclassified Duganella]|uniref:tautomerase family protein n=1 Tax=unclassified Duganella TaxID=2636909 RepID=UPI000885B677|nr:MULTISPECIES: tautomerase family protein [unclassified Duganella]SDG16866.1 Tautomerase enzyme [Duganella sp. OV458]SDJ31039.1 Tautomerase enzyme [Duganella sp. OV510]
MPMSRISLLKGRSPAYLRALGDSLQRAMEEAFNVPPRDRFQLIHQHEQHEMMIDPGYEGGPRSDNFVLIAITIGKPRSTEVKQAFYQRLVALLAESPGIPSEDVMVVVTAAQGEDWSFGGGRPAASLLGIRS